MRADRLVRIADRDRNLNGRIEHLAPVRQRFMRVAPHVKLLRRAADVDRDRLERELRFVRRLRGGGLLCLGRLCGILCGGGGGELRCRLGLGGVELRSRFRGLGAAFCFRFSARAWSVFAAASALSTNASSASARVFSLSSLRSDAVSDAASRAVVAAAFLASSAVLAAGRARLNSATCPLLSVTPILGSFDWRERPP